MVLHKSEQNQANIYLLKVNNRNTRKRCEICSKLTLKTPERRQRRQRHRSIFSSASIVDFEQVNVSRELRMLMNKTFGVVKNLHFKIFPSSKIFLTQFPTLLPHH